jgi:hypothetical protein
MGTLRNGVRITCLLALACAPSLRAQEPAPAPAPPQDQSSAPIPAYHSPLAGAADNEDSTDQPQKLAPDTRSPTGVQDFSLGTPPLQHSFWQPSFNLTSTGDSDALDANNKTGWTTYTTFLAGVDLRRITGGSDLTVSYIGGGTVSNDGAIGDSVTQELKLAQKFSFRRATISFFDQVTYLPEQSFGYGGLGGLTLPGGGSTGLQNGLAPDGTILTPRGQRITNAFLTQVDVQLNGRSSLTFVGGYTLLHYFDNNFLDFNDSIAQVGYNYQWTREDTISVLYRFNAYRYTGFNQSINDHVVLVNYGRRVTGRLALQIGVGPEVTTFATPINGSSSGTPTTNGQTEINWSLNGAATYGFERTTLGLSFARGVGGGSGILAGSESNTVSGFANHQFTRTLNGGINVGYARNSGLGTGALNTTATNQTYDYWYSGVTLNKSWGRMLNLLFNYQLQYQNSNNAFCVGSICGESIVRHMVSVGFSWRDHPLAF